MDDGFNDAARLEPAVKSAMSLRGTFGAVDPDAKRQTDENAPPITRDQFTRERYTAGLDREIEDNFLIRDWEKQAVLHRLAEVYGARYCRDDLANAVELANKLNYCAVFVQSSHGDGDEAIAELEKQVPGFSRGLYAELLGYIAYINR